MNTPDPSNVSNVEAPWLAAAAAGDRNAQRALFEQYRDTAYRVAFRITGRDADALDVVQDAFIKAFENLGSYEGGSSFKTWLLRIVSNRGLDLLRARKVRIAVRLDSGAEAEDGGLDVADPRSDASPAGGLEAEDLAARLNAALEALPPEQRAVFALFATGELSYAEIAEAVGVPIGTVMSRLFHARKRLQESLKDLADSNVRSAP